MDIGDHAHELEERARELALAKQKANTRNATLSLTHCIDCGVGIDEQRRRLVYTERCIGCQESYERVLS